MTVCLAGSPRSDFSSGILQRERERETERARERERERVGEARLQVALSQNKGGAKA